MSEPTARMPVLVITGMHRSGTSFTASLLQAAGLFIGDQLMGPHASNPLGHFEDLDFYEFDRHLLRSHGISDDGFACSAAPKPGLPFRQEALRLVEKRRARGTSWGWKDPRSALLLDFWHSVIPEARFLFVFRTPWDVVDSLYRRGDAVLASNAPLALDVWKHVNGLIVDFARSHPERTLVRDVAQIAAAPDATLASVRETLGIPLSDAPSTFRAELMSTAPADRADIMARVAPDCIEVWQHLRELAGIQHHPVAGGSSTRGDRDRILRDWQRLRTWERRVREHESLTVEAERVVAPAAKLETPTLLGHGPKLPYSCVGFGASP